MKIVMYHLLREHGKEHLSIWFSSGAPVNAFSGVSSPLLGTIPLGAVLRHCPTNSPFREAACRAQYPAEFRGAGGAELVSRRLSR
ncbi:MAG: hypothetical protein F9K47_13200 [Burkholderiales bacterium]|nr:MAG: hypothetical protein F9K47_13200 [Burkholderiales bacterium]